MTEEEILRKYKLTDEEHDNLYETIKRVYTATKTPSANPIAVIIGGQTGAGKSGLIGYSEKMFNDRNVIIINSDEIKPYHPEESEIAKLYPDLYTKITDQESNAWTSKLFEDLRREKYNLIFEGTMWNNRVADESIVELLDLGYTVIVRGLAVDELESRLSILERYVGQKTTKGFGRLVTNEHHDRTYKGMPNTIDYIESTGKYTLLEIFTRGLEDISEPQIIYSNINKNYAERFEDSILNNTKINHRKVSLAKNPNNFYNAKQAIAKGREESAKQTAENFEERLKGVQIGIPEVDEKIDSLVEIYQKVRN